MIFSKQKTKLNFTTLLFVVGWVFSGLEAQTNVQAPQKLTLDEAVRYALENSNAMKSVKLGVRDAEALIAATRSTGLPQVGAELGYNYFFQTPKVVFPASFAEAQAAPFTQLYGNFGKLQSGGVKDAQGNPINFDFPAPRTDEGSGDDVSFVQRNGISGGLTASQLIFSGSYTVALRASALARELASAQVSAKEMEVKNQVISTYLPALQITEGAKTLDVNIKSLEKLLVEVRATYKAGFIEQLDVDRLELSLSTLQTQRDALLRQKGLIFNALKLIIGMPMESELEITDNFEQLTMPVSEEELVGKPDLSRRRELMVLATVEKLQAVNVDLNKAGYLPTVAGFANWTANINSDNYFSKDDETFFLPQGLIGVKATMPLWDSREKKHKIERARIALQQTQLQRQDVERALTLQVLNSRIAVGNAQLSLGSQEKNLKLAEKIHNTTLIKFKQGVGSSLELTTAEQQLYTTQQSVMSARIDLLLAQRALLQSLGK
jgi:outer membrane protein